MTGRGVLVQGIRACDEQRESKIENLEELPFACYWFCGCGKTYGGGAVRKDSRSGESWEMNLFRDVGIDGARGSAVPGDRPRTPPKEAPHERALKMSQKWQFQFGL